MKQRSWHKGKAHPAAALKRRTRVAGPKHGFQPLIQATHFVEAEDVRLASEGYDPADEPEGAASYWINDIYQVKVNKINDNWVQLNIRRRDGKPIFRDWRHFQEIKNQLVGPECEAVELYPAESRKVDTSNKYHLWCCTDPTFRFPLGYQERQVLDHNPDRTSPGIKQRRL